MAAYVIFLREDPIRDPAAMADYQRVQREGAIATSMKAHVAYGATEALEGDAPDGVVVLEFPTVEEAKDWYNSPAYQAAIPHRHRAADYRAFIVQGL